METLKGSLTEKNLARAFFSESANIRKYEIYSKQAKREGFEQIAAIFLEVAEQKRSHTKTMYKFLEGSSLEIIIPFTDNGIGPTLKCLRDAATVELNESQSVFEEYERIAWEEGFKP